MEMIHSLVEHERILLGRKQIGRPDRPIKSVRWVAKADDELALRAAVDDEQSPLNFLLAVDVVGVAAAGALSHERASFLTKTVIMSKTVKTTWRATQNWILHNIS